MKILSVGTWMAVFFGSALLSSGAFVAPDESRLAAAAADPARLAPLLHDATVQEAARVIRSVLVQVVKAESRPAERDKRIRAVIREAFKAMPGKSLALAAALGEAMAGSPAACRTPGVLSLIQLALIDAAGSDPAAGAGLASSFGNSYTLSLQTIGSAPASGRSALSPPPPPPVAIRYDGQLIQ